MISYYKTINGRIESIDNYEPGCWINCVEPEGDEVASLIKDFNIEPDFFRASLDEEESSHIDNENGVTLIIIDIPVVEKFNKSIRYATMPIGIMITEKNVITVSIKENPILSEFSEGVVKDVLTNYKTQFVFHIMLRVAARYLQYIKQIDKISEHVEEKMKKSMKNKEIIQLFEIQKSLVYFSSSLKADEITLEKLMRGRHIKLYEDDQDLLEDVLIEIKQAIEMVGIHLNIMSSTMDTFSSVISNNLNYVMKVLASLTLIVSIPTVISGLYGMNIDGGLPFDNFWWFPFILSAVLMILAFIILKKNDMF